MIKTKKVQHTYVTDDISEVECDKCGKDIIINKDNIRERYANINIKTHNTYCQSDYSENNQLCNKCSRELYNWFTYKIENDKNYDLDVDYINPDDDFDKD